MKSATPIPRYVCRSGWAVVAVAGSVLAAVSVCALGAEDKAHSAKREQALIEKVISSITDNYDRLGALEAAIEQIAVDPTVTSREESTFETPGGEIFKMVREPRTVHSRQVLMAKGALRVQFEDHHIYVFRDGIWRSSIDYAVFFLNP